MFYSLVGRDIEHDVVPFCLDAGIGVMAWSPLAGGFLSGKYTRAQPKGTSGDRLGGFDFLPYDRERAHALVDLLKAFAAKRGGATPAQLAIAWVLSRSAVATVLVGASRADQLDDNLRATDIALDSDELAELDAMTKPEPPYPHWFNQRVADGKSHEALGIPLDVRPLR
jgi:aryl-alcohol dehydrogenase-like predicted oxidoreductase